jgi:hypothetical protein
MKLLIITNNERVNIEFMNKYEVAFLPEVNQTEILIMARDLIHTGARLIAHPMAGRIKPHETPYRSVILMPPEDRNKADIHTDPSSVIIIEDSISDTKKTLEHTAFLKYTDEMLSDLSYIDMLLIKSALDSTEASA